MVYEWEELHLTAVHDHTHRTLRETPVSRIVRDVERERGVSVDDYASARFLVSMWTIMVETDEMREPVLHVPMERLVSDAQYFSWFVSRITEGTSSVDSTLVSQTFAKGPMNESPDGGPALAHDIYAGLPEWQKECWRRVSLEKELQKRYDGVGYDFSFVRVRWRWLCEYR